MRRLVFGFGICLIMLGPVNDCFAQKMIDKAQINQRINSLRNRLKDYHKRFQTPQQRKAEELEEISEGLERRDDVAVTVLFTDPEAGKSNASFEPETKPVETEARANKKVAQTNKVENTSDSLTAIKNNESLTDEQKEHLLELEKRKRLFASLRKKVQQATRGSKKSAKDISLLVASID
jgi:hypothetical protein